MRASVRAMTRRSWPVADGAGRLDLALEFGHPDQFLPGAGEEAGVLREGLVFEDHGGRPGPRIGGGDMPDIDCIAVAGVEIGDERDRDLLDDRPGHVEMRREREKAGIGHAIGGRQFEAARPDAVEPGLLGEARGQWVLRRHQRQSSPPAILSCNAFAMAPYPCSGPDDIPCWPTARLSMNAKGRRAVGVQLDRAAQACARQGAQLTELRWDVSESYPGAEGLVTAYRSAPPLKGDPQGRRAADGVSHARLSDGPAVHPQGRAAECLHPVRGERPPARRAISDLPAMRHGRRDRGPRGHAGAGICRRASRFSPLNTVVEIEGTCAACLNPA